jgi:hypothetical protein
MSEIEVGRDMVGVHRIILTSETKRKSRILTKEVVRSKYKIVDILLYKLQSVITIALIV